MIDSKLLTLIKISETGSYTRAAQELSLTQPAVSQHIRQLERELGVVIFTRAGNQLHPTREGELAIQYARRIKSLYDALAEKISEEHRKVTRLRVGITHTSESNTVAETLARYCNAHDGVTVAVHTDTISRLYDMLTNYELDMAIVEGGPPHDGICATLLDTDELVLAVSNEHPLANKKLVTLAQLQKERMILRSPESGTRSLFAAHLESHHLRLSDFNVIMEVNNTNTIRDLVRRNYGVSILARSACADDIRKGLLTAVKVENLSAPREVNVLYHCDFKHTDVLGDLVDMYREQTKPV